MFLIVFVCATIIFGSILAGGATLTMEMNYKLLRDFLIYATVLLIAYIIEYFNIS